MPLALLQTVAPTVEPVTLEELKEHLRIDGSDEDSIIRGYLETAREHVESFCKRQLCTATWVLKLDEFPNGKFIELPRPPLISVTSLVYLDTANASQTWANTNYSVDTYTEPGRIILGYDKVWPTTYGVPNCITITYQAGYGATVESVPRSIRTGILKLAGIFYENREGSEKDNDTSMEAVYNLLLPKRCVWEIG